MSGDCWLVIDGSTEPPTVLHHEQTSTFSAAEAKAVALGIMPGMRMDGLLVHIEAANLRLIYRIGDYDPATDTFAAELVYEEESPQTGS